MSYIEFFFLSGFFFWGFLRFLRFLGWDDGGIEAEEFLLPIRAVDVRGIYSCVWREEGSFLSLSLSIYIYIYISLSQYIYLSLLSVRLIY